MVYVDTLRTYKSGKWCHMIADSDDELHAFANKIGLKREWWQPKNSHYDLRPGVRDIAVKFGAKELSIKDLARLNKRKKFKT